MANSLSAARPGPKRLPDRLALAALCLAAFAWRVAGLTQQSLWRDEVDSIHFATRALPELLRMFGKPGENGPLFFLLLRPWLALAGTSEFALRYQAALAGVLAAPLVYVLTRRMLRLIDPSLSALPEGPTLRNAPLVAALLVAVNPYLTWYSQEGKMYGGLVALALAVHLAFLAALEHGRFWRWLLYLGLLGATVLTHVLAVLLVAVHVAWFVILWPRYRSRLLAFTLTLLLPAVPFFVLAGWWQVRLFLTPGFQTGHPFVPAGGIVSALLVGFSRGVTAEPQTLGLAVTIFILLAGLALAGKAAGQSRAPTNPRLSALLATWLFLPPLLLYLITLSKPVFAERYLIWIGPAFAVVLALGLSALVRTWRPLGWLGLAFLVLWAGVLPGWQQAHVAVKADFRSAASYVESQRRPGDRVLFLIPYNRFTYEYYAGAQRDWVEGPYTNNGNPVSQVNAEMQERLRAAPAVWLVASEEGMWDQRGLVRAWLESHGRATDTASFHLVEVRRYELSSSQ